MRVRSFIGLVFFLAAAVLSGCGGGDGSSATPTTTVSGMASKGPIKAGKVKVFAIRAGIQDGVPLKEGPTDNNGNYTIDVGSYTGPVLVEVTGGSYTDEVSGATVILNVPLRAVVANASTGTKTVAVTPLTELAYKKAKGSGAFTAASINDANTKIAAMFKLADIVSTLPVAKGTSDDQKKYAAACGSFSQLINDNKGIGETTDAALSRLLNQLGDEMEHGSGFSLDSIGKLNSAITKFSSSDKNQTGGVVTPFPAPTSGLLKLNTSGTANNIGSIDVTVDLPAGVTLKADPVGEVAAGVVAISGVAAVGANKLVAAKYTSGTPGRLNISLANTTGFGAGEFATIKFDLAAGGSFPASKDAFSVSGFTVKDQNSVALVGVTAAPAALGAEL